MQGDDRLLYRKKRPDVLNFAVDVIGSDREVRLTCLLIHAGVKLITLTDYDSIIAKAVETDYISEADVEMLKEWRKSPDTWNPATRNLK